MLQTPSKFLPRSFLKALLENRCISPSGIEYCEPEVIELLHEKESRLALADYAKDIRSQHEASTFNAEIVLRHQRDIVSQAMALCENNSSNIIFPLPELNSIVDSSLSTAPSDRPVQPQSEGFALPIIGAKPKAVKRGEAMKSIGPSAFEKSLKISSKPKEISFEQAMRLCDEWEDQSEKEIKRIKSKRKKALN